MSYTPTTWNTGDTITASAMNKIENGIANAGSALIVTQSNVNGEYTLDKTVQEIYDAISNGTPAYLIYIYGSVIDEFIGEQYLCPIMGIYRYGGMTDQYRIAISRPRSVYSASGVSSKIYIFKTSYIVYHANSLSDYPTFYVNVTVNDNTLST